MRNEQEMYDLILSVARSDERVRAVVLNGSRANPNAPRDIFQDFDVVYLVTDVKSFKKDKNWIGIFGDMMILQLPNDMGDPEPENHAGYAYLMQFMDGNRIDLTVYPKDAYQNIVQDSLSIVLLDKDGMIPPLAEPSDRDYLPIPPTEKQLTDCCNEFWWVCPYVAKGLWRNEILYAKCMLDEVVRPQLMKMLKWYIGVKTDFKICPGKCGKYMQKYLEPELWHLLMSTFTDSDISHTWDALENMGKLFRIIAIQVTEKYHYPYPSGEDQRVSDYLQKIRQLPIN
ncbi:MAG: aminoglycoside 6-adenylyltransferase [Anaerolineaceae bacterium]